MSSKILHTCRFAHKGQPQFGRIEGDKVVPLAGDPIFEGASAPAAGDAIPLPDVQLLAPVTARKILAIGRNYRSHLGGRDEPTEPGIFIKMSNTLIGPGDPVPIPPDAKIVQTEGELVVVIGKTCRDVSPGQVKDRIYGITCGHDISIREWQRGDLQWFRAKSCDGFGPVGPSIAVGLDYANVLVQSRVNGEVKQSERTDKFIFSIEDAVAYISRYVTLDPGDLLFTGTPGTAPDIKPGDTIEAEVEGVGVLSNPVVARD